MKFDLKVNRTKMVIAILAFLIIVVILFIIGINGKNKTDYYKIKPVDINYSILSNCVVEYPDPLDLTVSGEGDVTKIYKKEGDSVKKDETIIQLDDFVEKRNYQTALNNLQTAELKLKNANIEELPSLKERLNLDKINLDQAKTDLDRKTESFKSGGISSSELDDADNSYKKALSQYNQTKLSYDSFNTTGKIAELTETVKNDRVQLELAKNLYDNRTVRSPFDGMVLAINVQVGQKIGTGKILATIIEKKNWLLVLNVDQKEMGFLQLGQKATVVFDAYPNKKISAITQYVCSTIDKEKGTCEIRLEIKENYDFIKHGMTGNSEIQVAKYKQVKAIPARFVKKLKDGDYVYKWNGKTTEQEKVTGIRIGERWMIPDDINDGTMILDPNLNASIKSLVPGNEIKSF
jgi:HlyD family secretion protein